MYLSHSKRYGCHVTDMQAAFDKDWKRGRINQYGWYKNATDNAVIGYTLMLQTGDMVKPIDKSRVSEISHSEVLFCNILNI